MTHTEIITASDGFDVVLSSIKLKHSVYDGKLIGLSFVDLAGDFLV